ncbi:uncharacterized protein LOC143353089 isoform X2 [Halictus rubicundus]|uniref:uncharacterized protein LOC143353089 isoform X2 n=1 Tax=Halictus rubicundus TaxID=77578 RepID=UPI004036641C
MDVFRRNYNTYYLILRFTGLWPFDDSILPKIQRTFFSVFTLCCILIQVSTLQHVEITFNNILTTLSYACPMLLYFLRYLGFAANFALVKSFLQDLQNDCAEIQNPAEAKILKKHMEKTRRIFLLFLCLSILGITFVSARVVIPAILRSKYQLYTLRSFGFFYTEQSRHADWACVHLSLTTAIGMLTIACTEGTLAVFSLYLCGLFEIVGYRMRGTIDNAAQLGTSKQIDIGPAIVMHQRAFKLAQSVGDRLLISYLLAIIVVIVSFAVNLYRASLLMLEKTHLDEAFTAILVVMTHLIVMFLNNYSGQQLANTSNYVFNETSAI